MSAEGLGLVKEFEGLRLKAYKCPAGVWTIGYGHTSAAGSPDVNPGMEITKDEAEEILKRDMVQYEAGVEKLVKVELSQGQFDALVDFAYNAGVGALAKSTLLKRVNEERFDDVPAEFMKWTKGGGKELPGLVRRRRAEVKLWRGLETEKPVCNDEARAEPDMPVPKKSIVQSKEANGAVIAGGAGAIAVVQEVMPIIKEGGDILSAMSTTALVCLVIVVAAAAIWYFRKQRLDEEGA
jgi:GH24 family phage-related lysozyme (muramidase)